MDFSEVVPKFKNEDLYLYLSEENPDWFSDEAVDMLVHYKGRKAILPLSDRSESSLLSSSIHHFVDPSRIIMSWMVKDVFSYFKGTTGILPEFPCPIYDLHILSSYFGLSAQKPGTMKDAMALLGRVAGDPGWKSFKKFYDSVYAPLFSEVIPSMETGCLVDNRRRTCVHPSYVIEGQANGRLKAVRSGNNSYNPHSLGSPERSSLRPPDYDETFVYLDYRNMEVNVLRWLSGDRLLGAIIDSGRDPYSEIWKILSGADPAPSQRDLCKNIFLPVVFGQGKASLAKKMGISEKNAGILIDSLVKSFPVAFDWVESQVNRGGDVAIDAFGRRRAFNPGESYKIRNFCIQSPASMICLKKLVRLHQSLPAGARICFHVHDGYCIICKKSDVAAVSCVGVKALEEEDGLFPGLSLSVSCESGTDLENLELVEKE